MEINPQSLTIGAAAAAASVGVETIRFYQRKGLLDEPDRPPGRIRRYAQRDVARVRFIKSAQRLGFSLDEVSGLLVLEDCAGSSAHCAR